MFKNKNLIVEIMGPLSMVSNRAYRIRFACMKDIHRKKQLGGWVVMRRQWSQEADRGVRNLGLLRLVCNSSGGRNIDVFPGS